MNSDEQNHTEFLFLQSCGILSELQLQQLTSKQKKELLSLSEDKESGIENGIENGIESITQIHDTINTFELIQQILIDKLQRKLTRVAKKLSTFETYQQNETKRNELEKIQVKTPLESFNILMNGWLIYQTIISRMKARTGFYQSGGAFGFRDQLQDTLGIRYVDSNYLKEQIINCARHQFIEGDVEHWWHEETR